MTKRPAILDNLAGLVIVPSVPTAWQGTDRTGCEYLVADRADVHDTAAVVGVLLKPLFSNPDPDALSSLAAYVAGLQAEVNAGHEAFKSIEAESNSMREVATANRHRAEAAEARVKELEARLVQAERHTVEEVEACFRRNIEAAPYAKDQLKRMAFELITSIRAARAWKEGK